MTSQTALRELTQFEDRYVKAWEFIEQLKSCATVGTERPLPTKWPLDWPTDAVEALSTDRGQHELARWLASFSRTIKLMAEFNEQVAANKAYTAKDWKMMAQSAESALGSLARSLTRLAKSTASAG